MSNLFNEVLEEVTSKKRNTIEQYPTIAEVREALERHSRQDIFNLLMWHKHLRNAKTPREQKTLDLIDEGLMSMKI